MIQCVFTLDYELYGDGHGSLRELVYEPARRLYDLFSRRGVHFVTFVEAAELEKIEQSGTDKAIDLVREQIREFFGSGVEIALHLHPQWYNATYQQGHWLLDLSEYNLCVLPQPRIVDIVDRALAYLRYLVDSPSFTPLSFRAGNWLLQPTQPAAGVLSEAGVRIDSSVFKGGLQRGPGLDYRPSLQNGDYWRFAADVNEPDPRGALIEVPIHAVLVPFWKVPTSGRLRKPNNFGAAARASAKKRLIRLGDFARLRYPLKLDFCRMTLKQLISTLEPTIREGRNDPGALTPVVAIGHTKDLLDVATVERFLAYLEAERIQVVTFEELYPRLSRIGPAVLQMAEADRPTAEPRHHTFL